MNRKTVSITVLVAIVALIGYRLWSVHKAPLPAAGTPPSAKFIAEAMKNQEKPGMALQARYSWKNSGIIREKPRVEEEAVSDVYYVRTPETIFLKEKVTKNFRPAAHASAVHDANSTVTSSYNRTTGEYRELTTRDDGSPPQGITDNIKTHLSMVSRLMVLMHISTYNTRGDLEGMTRVESVVDYIFGAPLYRLVKTGAVLEKKEIDGHNCWAVVHDTIPDVQRCVIWVDPDIGFCPRRIDLIMKKQLRRGQTMRDYQKIGDGVWFPKEVVFEAFSKTGKPEEKYKITVKDAKLVPIGPKVELQVTFPPGVNVTDREGQK